MKDYDRTVAAALSETRSKFALAEALALDIPPRRQGRGCNDDVSVTTRLDKARQAIIDAGGEPKSVPTLAQYRETAIWVMSKFGVNTKFGWVEGASFTAHNEARRLPMSLAEFTTLTPGERKIEQLRKDNGRAGRGGKPETIAESWTPQELAQVAGKALADPDVAREALADPKAAEAAVEALMSTPESADRTYQAARDSKIKHARRKKGKPDPPPKTDSKADAKRERIIRLEQIADEMIVKLADVLDPDLDPVGQTLEFIASNLDALSDSYRQRLARAIKELTARASDWEDRMLGISGHTMTAPLTPEGEQSRQ